MRAISRCQLCTCYFILRTLNLCTCKMDVIQLCHRTLHTSSILVFVVVFDFIGSLILHLLKLLNDAFPVIGVPKSAVPECQCLWCAWVLWEVQWTWGECKAPFSSIFSVELCTEACETVVTSLWGFCIYLFSRFLTSWAKLSPSYCPVIAHNSRATVCLQCSLWVMAAPPIRYNQSSLSHWG